MAEEIARYKVLRTSYLHKRIYEEGEEVEYEGKPGSALEPLNDAAHAAKGTNATTSETGGDAGGLDVGNGTGDGGGNQADIDLAALREQYEALFNKKPGNMSADTIKAKITEERARLGV
ncbi:hypothetical protein LLS47_12285 [Rouxiella badensis]|uniref:hypothetical protein n=1 Tax=Rouxiella badensis TaxID=1646377 RepID=UPI001D147B38|nr:hypothetical protein [Rouxiella badensis]MCC3733706.1 hypothetical protein [Rouxiella badensis]MCC3759641.1 hypothetical protein [Rouxiella badensis]